MCSEDDLDTSLLYESMIDTNQWTAGPLVSSPNLVSYTLGSVAGLVNRGMWKSQEPGARSQEPGGDYT